MVSEIYKRKERKSTIYDRNIGNKPFSVMDELFAYIAPCPVCAKRVFDVDDLPGSPIRIRIKCPHCRKIVSIPISGF